MTATATGLLAALEGRAGASDKDRELWLAERRGGITATEIRDLYLRKITVQQLIDLKLGLRVDSFGGNQYTAWGNAREPVLAELVETVYGLAPESRVFHAADNARFLASPDGLGLHRGDLAVVEIKTGKDDIRVGTPAYVAKGYAIQQTWVMRVLGGVRSLYVSEQHDSDWQDRGGRYPEPAPIDLVPTMEWVEYDEALAKELETLAVGFLVALDAAAAGEVVPWDEDLDTMAVNLLRFREEESLGKKAKETTWAELQSKLRGEHDELSQESPLARITWRAGSSRTVVENVDVPVVDLEAAKADAPQTWAHVELSRQELEDTAKQLADAEEQWQAVLARHTTTQVEAQARVQTVKESLTVTSVKPKKEPKK